MYYHDKRLQYPVTVDKPNPQFARMLQQAIGGVEGEIRVCMQYFFQAWGNRAPTTKYRDMLLHTATEEIGHIEMLATAVALNLEKAPASLQEDGAADGIVGAVMGGGNAKHAIEGMIHKNLLSSGLAAMPMDSDGVPFNMSHIYASGNVAADMYCNVAAESTGRVLAVRLFNAAEDDGMKKMLHYMIARDTMHQQQWLAVIEELGAEAGNLPIRIPSRNRWKTRTTITISTPRRWTVRCPKDAGRAVRRWTVAESSRSSPIVRWARNRYSARHGPTAARRTSRSPDTYRYRRACRR
ncbi:manganese catalase family protein [Sphingomonas aliaeris]|uniref:manganese catalase family protein n=1 Tax=Sphingomonas aliaeris TaxID=2759526 RepID=UPI0019221074|nr:manganese catalase family protein [Sphingomonas aliaeris]